LTTPILAHLA
jgi:hypothetical protein